MSTVVDTDIETDIKCLGIHDETHETHDFEIHDFVAQVKAHCGFWGLCECIKIPHRGVKVY